MYPSDQARIVDNGIFIQGGILASWKEGVVRGSCS